MAESHVISALVAKRAELAGLLEHHQKEIKRIRENITTIDSSIKIFEPDYNIQSIKVKRYRRGNNYFQPREANRLILEVLREAGEPIDTGEVTKRVAEKKGYKLEELDYSKFQSYLTTTMSRQRSKGLIREAKRVSCGKVILWGIAV